MPAWMIPGLLGAELDLAALGRRHRAFDVHRHRAQTRVRHQPARTEDFAQTADDAPSCPGSRRSGRSRSARLDLFRQVFGAHHVGSGGARLIGLLPAANTPMRTSCRCRSAAGDPAHRLVGVPRIDAEVQRHFNRFVELRFRVGLDQADRLIERVGFVGIDRRVGRLQTLPLPSISPPPRSDPSTSRSRSACDSGLDVVGVHVLHLLLGDLPQLGRGDPADGGTLARGRAALVMPAAFFRK